MLSLLLHGPSFLSRILRFAKMKIDLKLIIHVVRLTVKTSIHEWLVFNIEVSNTLFSRSLKFLEGHMKVQTICQQASARVF